MGASMKVYWYENGTHGGCFNGSYFCRTLHRILVQEEGNGAEINLGLRI